MALLRRNTEESTTAQSSNISSAPVLKNKVVDYQTFLSLAQGYLSHNYADVLADSKSAKDIIPYIEQFYNNSGYVVQGMSATQLAKKCCEDMAQYSILTEYLDSRRTDIEEINLNSWEDIAIHSDSGSIDKSPNTFIDSTQAIDVMKRALNKAGMVLDMAKPIVRGFLDKNKRLTVIAKPIVDDDVGVATSIRIVNPKQLSKDDFLRYNTATEEMLDFLCNCIRYGVSECITGSTGSGKTTLMSWVLSTIPNDKRVITIEEGVREFSLIKRDESGKVINNVVHLKTKQSDNENETITSEQLVSTCLTMNPDILVVAEMKDAEAFAAQEAARTGHAVMTTIHAKSAAATYARMCTLCMLKHNIKYDIVDKLVKEAFPIVVFCKRLEDNSRHVMNISECYIDKNGESHIQTLWQYVITSSTYDENGKCNIVGHYEKVNPISEYLQRELLENGMPKDVVTRIVKGE